MLGLLERGHLGQEPGGQLSPVAPGDASEKTLLEAALQEARDSWNESTAEYLIAHPQLADHLRDGLDSLGYSCEV